MSGTYVELYKKYRPGAWSDLIGQQRVASSLRAAVVNNSLPTAYGMFGPRGTGKTSAAMLLAKSLNCLNPQAGGNPCNTCEVCVAIDSNSQMGVNYVSMANQGSVDDVRSIVQKARLGQPVKKQIWVLDEVHNLSKPAFDSLLIPLEERSMPSLFILCSTEVDKIPQTIMSRIQQRKFTLVSPDDMRPYLKGIVAKESLAATDEMIDEAIRTGKGSVRATLSALEDIVVTGSSSTSFGERLIESLADLNLPGVLAVVSEANSDGYDGRDLAEDLFSDLRDILLLSSGVPVATVGTPPVKNVKAVATKLMGSRGLFILSEEVGAAITQMTIGADSRINLEIALVKSISRLLKLRKALSQQAGN